MRESGSGIDQPEGTSPKLPAVDLGRPPHDRHVDLRDRLVRELVSKPNDASKLPTSSVAASSKRFAALPMLIRSRVADH
jgi:hypothetical protein